MTDSLYKRIKASPGCSSETFCLPKRCPRLLPELANLPSPSCPKKGANPFLGSAESSVRLPQTLHDWNPPVPPCARGTKAEKSLLGTAEMQLSLSGYHWDVFPAEYETFNLNRDTASLQEICNTNQNIFTGFWDLLFCMQMVNPAAVSSFPFPFQIIIEDFGSISQG